MDISFQFVYNFILQYQIFYSISYCDFFVGLCSFHLMVLCSFILLIHICSFILFVCVLFCLFVCLFVCVLFFYWFLLFNSMYWFLLHRCFVLFYCFLMYSWFPHWVPTTIFSHIFFISQIYLKNSNAQILFFFLK